LLAIGGAAVVVTAADLAANFANQAEIDRLDERKKKLQQRYSEIP